jgi:hypothetical protein
MIVGNVALRWGLCAIAAGLAAPAAAANWKYIATADNETMLWLDTESIRSLSENRYQIWVKHDFSRVRSRAERESKQLQIIHCDTRSYDLVSWIMYMPDGSIASSHTLKSYEREVSPIVPDSVLESILDQVCVSS